MGKNEITIKELIEDVKSYINIEIIAGEKGLNRKVSEKYISRPGYLLAGYEEHFPADSIQILGNRDIGYLSTLNKEELQKKIERFLSFNPPGIVIAWGHEAPSPLIKGCSELKIPLMRTDAPSAKVSEIIQYCLEERLADVVYIHGDLVDVFGIGLLITGESGMGKSELALDLVNRGHRLVADDIVCIKRKRDVLFGEEKEKENILRHNIEIRGVGILNVAALFGVKAIRMKKRVEMQLDLVRWEKSKDYTRTGLEMEETEILGVPIPKITIPLIPGKNIATIAEVIAIDYLGKGVGFYSGEIFEHELIKKLQKRQKKYMRLEEDEE
ncbi:MAG: HPr(Ser) kinase/phosphatase [candidate division WOR-3 bacterium]